MPLRDGARVQQHCQYVAPKELLQGNGVIITGKMKAIRIVKAAVGYDDVAMGVEAEKIAEGLDGAGATGDGCVHTSPTCGGKASLFMILMSS